VERLVRLNYGSLIIEETQSPASISDKTTQIFTEALRARGFDDLIEAEAVQTWLARLELVARLRPDESFPAPEEILERAFMEWCRDAQSIGELRHRSFLAVLHQLLTPKQASTLARMAPERLALRSRQVSIHYERGRDPWIQSRLQDFFGSTQGPRIGDGQLRLVLHLLAPNQRAVQVTTDLAGFWERHYPSIRKELMRKYPRHAWPENPLEAQPPSRHR
jgi:ATP-dependent helicase HrpB